MSTSPFIVWFDDIDVHETTNHGKTVKHYGKLAQAGFPLLPGFVVTNDAYFAFLEQNHLDRKIHSLLTLMDHRRPETVHQTLEHVRKEVMNAKLPQGLEKILSSFHKELKGYPLVLHAYASTAHAQKVTNKKVETGEELVSAIKDIWAAQFEPNIHHTRNLHGHHHTKSGVEIIIQISIEPEKQGRMITRTNHNDLRNVITISHTHPHAHDHYIMTKQNLMLADRMLNHHFQAPKLDYDELLAIAGLGNELETFLYFPQEVSWGIYGNALYLLQSKPLTESPQEKPHHKKHLPHTRGTALTHTMGTGIVRIILDKTHLDSIQTQDIVVMHKVEKRDLKHLKRARGIITETGEKHSEVATLLRQLGIPIIIATNATKQFTSGQTVTIHGPNAEIYIGGVH